MHCTLLCFDSHESFLSKVFCFEISLALSNTFSFENCKYEVKRLHLQLFAKKESTISRSKVEWIIEIWRKRQFFLKAGEETTSGLGRSTRDLFCFCLPPSTILRDGYYLLWKTIHFPRKKTTKQTKFWYLPLFVTRELCCFRQKF